MAGHGISVEDTGPEKEARAKLRALRLSLQEFVGRNRPVQWVFATLVRIGARLTGIRGQVLPELRVLLHGSRHVDKDIAGRVLDPRLRSLIHQGCWRGSGLQSVSENGLLSEFLASSRTHEIKHAYDAFPMRDRVRMRKPRPDRDEQRQGNLLVLKKFIPGTGEKGVLLIKYNPAIEAFPGIFDLEEIAAHYSLVLEPSWWGYRHARFLPYLGADLNVLVMAQYQPDFEFIQSLESNLEPLALGPSDWTDPAIFRKGPAQTDRDFDVVMVAAWTPFKRHKVLFRALRELRSEGRELRAILIGYPWDWTMSKVQRQAADYGVSELCTFRERISPGQVADLVARSRVSVSVSKVEGSPKALYESLFCDTPVLVHRENKGINLSLIQPPVGDLTDDETLGSDIAAVLDHPGRYSPADWAEHNTGYRNASNIVNEALKQKAISAGQPWTVDIVPKRNAPHLRYANQDDEAILASEFEALQQSMRGVSS